MCRGAVVPPVLSSVFSAGARGEGLRGGRGRLEGGSCDRAAGQNPLCAPSLLLLSPPPRFSYRVLVRTICFLAGPYCLVVLEGLITCRIGRNHFFFLPFVFSFTFLFFSFFFLVLFFLYVTFASLLSCAPTKGESVLCLQPETVISPSFVCFMFFSSSCRIGGCPDMCVSLGGTPFTRVQFGRQRRGAFTLRWHS